MYKKNYIFFAFTISIFTHIFVFYSLNIKNDKLIKKSDNHLAIAQKGISILNKVNQSNIKNLIQYPNSTADYYTLGTKILDKN